MIVVKLCKVYEYRELSVKLDDFIIPNVLNTIKFDAETKLEEEEWFYIEVDQSHKKMIDNYSDCFINSVSLNEVSDNDFSNIEVIVKQIDTNIIFQKITSSKRIVNKSILKKPEDKKVEMNTIDNGIEITSKIDAYYSEDRLYFKNFAIIKSMFENIEDFYREATSSEVFQFKALSLVSVSERLTDLGTRNLNMLAIVNDDDEIDLSDSHFKEKMLLEYQKYSELDFEVDNQQFIINSKKQLNIFLKLALGRLYENPMTRQKMEASSAKKIHK
ncbi:hypothetical protein KIJ05_01330 [Leuconostoc gelidum subsp. gasicomitatum]|uniref:hypothetical protein n=1 Tax=Leuconostoc gasicomitatum TaxID=115778 RepID=UPI001CC6DABE|nr:hypothetical protein [Leuconostoc gasicomitatum]MBZ5983780.1 hypothetical protein [Leuconostoc gasicomitatum]